MLMQSNMRKLIHYPQTNDALLAQTSLVLSPTKLNKLKENKLINAHWIIKACLSLKRLREDFAHWLSRGFCQVTLLPFSLRNANNESDERFSKREHVFIEKTGM